MKQEIITLQEARNRNSRFGSLKFCESYKPKLKKLVLGLGGFLILVCLVTPATNWMIPKIAKETWRRA